MSANTKLWETLANDGLRTLRASQWTIGTYAANGNAYGLVAAADPSRKRISFRISPGTESLWTGGQIRWSPIPNPVVSPSHQTLVLIQAQKMAAQTLGLSIAGVNGNPVNAPGGVGTYDIPSLIGSISTPTLTIPQFIPEAVIEHYAGPIYLVLAGGIVGADKQIDVIDQAWD